MATIKRLPWTRHFRGEPTFHTLRYRRGDLVASGRGLSFWFRPLRTAIAEVPIDDRDAPFLFHGRSADFQEVTVQGVLTYRVTAAEVLAERVDFTIDVDAGSYLRTPLEHLAGLLTQLAQELTLDWLARTDLRVALVDGLEHVRARIQEGFAGDQRLTDMGVEIVAVRVAAVRPTADLERALQTPTLEALQQQADEATFERRALAVEKERAISENELQNQIELARREERLIEQRGANERRRIEDEAAGRRIDAQATAERSRIAAAAEADGIRAVEAANAEAQQLQMDVYRDLPIEVLFALALRELAGKLERIDHLSLAPDALGPALSRLVAAGSRVLEAGEDQ